MAEQRSDRRVYPSAEILGLLGIQPRSLQERARRIEDAKGVRLVWTRDEHNANTTVFDAAWVDQQIANNFDEPPARNKAWMLYDLPAGPNDTPAPAETPVPVAAGSVPESGSVENPLVAKLAQDNELLGIERNTERFARLELQVEMEARDAQAARQERDEALAEIDRLKTRLRAELQAQLDTL